MTCSFNELNKKLVQDMLGVAKTVEDLSICSGKIAKAYSIAQSSDLQMIYDKTRA